MSENTGKGKTARKTASEAVEAAVVTEPATAKEPAVKERFVPKDIDPDQIVTVRNGFQGRLAYQSRRTGELWVWDSFGAEQDMELSELKNARNSNKKFFINNWFMFDEDWVVDYLGMRQYYKHSLNIQNFDKLFEKSADEIADIISELSAGQRKSVAYRARQLIAEEKIDSNKVIATLERCLGVELIER